MAQEPPPPGRMSSLILTPVILERPRATAISVFIHAKPR
jgi:hypothetical protein